MAMYIATLIGLTSLLFITGAANMPYGFASFLTGVLVLAVVAERRSIVESDQESSAAPEELTDRRRRVLIVGAGTVGRSLADALEAEGSYRVVGFVDDQLEDGGSPSRPVLGTRSTAMSIMQEYDIEEVFVAYAPTWQHRLAEHLLDERPGVRVTLVPSPVETLVRKDRVHSIGD